MKNFEELLFGKRIGSAFVSSNATEVSGWTARSFATAASRRIDVSEDRVVVSNVQ